MFLRRTFDQWSRYIWRVFAMSPDKGESSSRTSKDLSGDFAWLADAPMFIDTSQVAKFYDAIVRPEVNKKEVVLQTSQNRINEIRGKVLGSGTFDLNLPEFLSFLNAEAKVGGEVEGKGSEAKEDAKTIILEEINTPQRQLQDLTVHYLVNYPKRVFLTNNMTDSDWRDPEMILKSPRAVALINLPGHAEATSHGMPPTRLIPIAAEFSDGVTELLYQTLRAKDGRYPPEYPDAQLSQQTVGWIEKQKNYWKWFADNFDPTTAMIELEKAGAAHGRIRWIAYRVPITNDGDTLHLTISPREQYDTGVFGYDFIKRGFKHGIRLVGTLKSEPDMNVLAIYEK